MVKFKGFQDFDVSLDEQGGHIAINQYDPSCDHYYTVNIPVDLWHALYQAGLHVIDGGLE